MTDRFAALGAAAEKHVGPSDVPGLVALVSQGDEVHVEARGRLAVDGPPVRRDSLFRISSTTKPITAAATLALAGEGLFDLADPVDRLLPELADRRVLRHLHSPLDDTVPAVRPVTVRDLLTFTFGFGMVGEMFAATEPWPVVTAAGELHLATFGPPEPQTKPDPDTWIAHLGSLPLMAQPGERWMYNTGSAVLSVLLARAAGTTYGEVLRTRLFEPLGMRDTGFFAADTGRLATAYRPSPDGLTVLDAPDGAWGRPPAFEDGADGLVSTVDDLHAFGRMLLRGGDPVLTPAAVRAMTSDQLTPGQKARGGLGADFFAEQSWGYGGGVLDNGSYGWAGGLGTTWMIDPAHDLTIVVLTQREFESPSAPDVHHDLQTAVYAAL
ncbi:serine hydrolase domain-containing protein [Actinocatenispora rupis]|uniref:Serine hydrolase n=1 Tax=Actinocatenispora rupis TaxID=519421 RepID=A0A8J3IUQ6_9ACTN|nr:serine hydrolase domain-containing protein [Actinocatenispora rupis]GID10271.1 serine hydrolase [Actinocatenispora rupis]